MSSGKPKTVWVDWEDLYGPMPYFEDDDKKVIKNLITPRRIEVPAHTATKWKRIKTNYKKMVEELEDLVER